MSDISRLFWPGRRHSRTSPLSLLVEWAATAVAVWAAASIVPGIHYTGWESILVVALVLGLLNVLARPILVRLSLPLTVLSLGIWLVVLNAILFWAAARIATHFQPVRFTIDRFFWDAILGAIVVSFVSWAIHELTHR